MNYTIVERKIPVGTGAGMKHLAVISRNGAMSEEQLNRIFALNDDGQTIYINSVENRAKSLYAHPDDFCPEGCMTMEEWEEECRK
jgi:hypothetical protein